ncbi:MAG TPA: hypothetical protein DCP92_17695 [Nitrospiraceae bacterium]|nr:hypothetical protein [Nitrospiraceae bacterium]
MGLSSLRTKDLFLAALLFSEAMYLKGIEVEEGTRVVFCFLDTSKLEELNRQYREGRAVCNVVKLRESLQYLKDRMFTLLRNEERRYAHSKRGDRGDQACARP